jgi:hypothetical protein
MATQFYVYTHARPGTTDVHGIFYVGKGKYDRAYNLSQSQRKHYHLNIIKKYGAENIIIRVLPCKDESHALMLEVEMIEVLRRMGVKLANLTNGGEGTSGYKYTNEQVERLKKSLNNPITKGKVSLSSKERWGNIDYKSKVIDSIKKAYSNPELKKKVGESTKEAMKDTEMRKRMNCAHKIAQSNPILLERRKQITKDLWNDNEFRNKMKISHNNYFVSKKQELHKNQLDIFKGDSE